MGITQAGLTCSFLWLTAVALLLVPPAEANELDQSRVIYVDHSATGSNTGTSWADAYPSLSSALAVAGANDQVWVATGIYKPTMGSSRGERFLLMNGASLYGGFLGNEVNLAQRDIQAHPTVLSGDIGVIGLASDNSYQVLEVLNPYGVETQLDGLVLRDTYDGPPAVSHYSPYGGRGSLGVRNCTFIDNIDTNALLSSHLSWMKDCAFINNTGGDSIVSAFNDDALIQDCLFEGNDAAYEVIHTSCSDIQRCQFLGNNASACVQTGSAYTGNYNRVHGCLFEGNSGVAVKTDYHYAKIRISHTVFRANGSGINVFRPKELEIDRCVFSENGVGVSAHAIERGMISNSLFEKNETGANLSVVWEMKRSMFINNTVVWNGHNSSSLHRGGLVVNGPLYVVNTILYHNEGPYSRELNQVRFVTGFSLIDYCCIDGYQLTPGVGHTAENPRFVNQVRNNYHLRFDSPLLDQGHPGTVRLLGGNNLDIDGQLRRHGPRADIGMDERLW